ncbi:hypothetical protein SYNPS1DRAFT_28921 [Syncephalis pseudoplumigaleata]|uniref:Cation-transporting P-type ATPase C-terminal domain-containing protein n=1 Tax=Syncephalis pseudoplumigaleata TaxID=1712513 RepID=A0A4P9YZ00_9FUNG|nr:hypothetical protein SYNPS1DRAFT_28921 [Syncephalis pseudoplumigaleata]|eukprot:RKP25346.1 hypothetical protein SYNPS1DRAFT_28921 [Syncephalis pseudoplumigaleata]
MQLACSSVCINADSSGSNENPGWTAELNTVYGFPFLLSFLLRTNTNHDDSADRVRRSNRPSSRAQIIDERQTGRRPLVHYLKLAFAQPESIAILVTGLLLLSYYGYTRGLGHAYAQEDLIAGIGSIVVFILNGNVIMQEKRFADTEMLRRAQLLVGKLSKRQLQYNETSHIPDMPSIRMVRVVREGRHRRLFTNLLAKGDVVELALGEQAPADARWIADDAAAASTSTAEPFVLTRHTRFLPTDAMAADPTRTHYAFELLSTPFAQTLHDMLVRERPRSSFEGELSRMRLLWQRAICVVFVLAIFVVTLRFILLDIVELGRRDRVFEAYIQVVLVLMPMLPMGIITLIHLCRLCATARLITLFELLQASKSAFEESEEVDEFDEEAPPPTKDVHVKLAALCLKMFSLLRGKEQHHLTRSVDIIASLGNMTGVCALDREGTLCAERIGKLIHVPVNDQTVPTLNQLLVPNADDDMVMLDVEEAEATDHVHFEDAAWQDYLPTLKPLGLNFILNGHCWPTPSEPPMGPHLQSRSATLLPPVIRPISRQTCLCRAATEIGFTPATTQKFKRRGELCAAWDQRADVYLAATEAYEPQPSLMASIHEALGNGTFQLLSEGEPAMLLACCADYWDGQGLVPMNEEMLRRLMDFQQTAIINDLACIAFAYRPMMREELEGHARPVTQASNTIPFCTLGSPDQLAMSSNSNDDDTTVPDMVQLLDRQIFLGYATLLLQPKADVREFIEDLGMSGIRFVYFSPLREQPSKAFGDRIGLDTDWNSCIILSSYEEGVAGSQGYIEQHDIKARLPRGVEQVREHLKHVDDIPLHVSLFAECAPESNIGMMETFQAYGDIVCAMGSVLNDVNVPQFATANIAIGVEPLPRSGHREMSQIPSTIQETASALKQQRQQQQRQSTGRVPALVVSSLLNRLACSFTMKHDTSLYVLNQLIGEARQFLFAFRQAIAFFMVCSVSLALILFFSSCMVLPQALSAGEAIWTITIILPILCFSLVNAPQDPDIMKIMPGKNTEHRKPCWSTMLIYGIRLLLPTGMCVVVFILSLASSLNLDATAAFVFRDHRLWYDQGEREQQAIRYARQCCIFSYVYFMGNIIAQGIYTLVTMSAIAPSGASYSFSFLDLPWHVYFMVFAWPVVFMPVQELVKWRERIHYIQLQKRRKLEFNTKLGMHSPV